MTIRIIATLIVVASLYFYIFHLSRRGAEPHTFWALVGGVVLIVGLWFALPGREKS